MERPVLEEKVAHRAVSVSILIVNYRAYEELASCLGSLNPYLADDVQIVVVDHETDPSAVRAIVDHFPSVRLIRVADNPGFAAGVNRAAAAAEGKYLLLLNPDCVSDSDVPHVLAAWLDQHPEVGVAGGLVREQDGSIQASARRFPNITTGLAGRTSWLTRALPGNPWSRRNLIAPPPDENPIVVDWVSGACMMVRREAFDRVGGMDEKFFLYWEDADLCYRLRQAGWSSVYCPRASVTHLTGRSSRHARRRSIAAFHDSAFRYFCKHGGPLARTAAPVVFVALHARRMLSLAQMRFDRRAVD